MAYIREVCDHTELGEDTFPYCAVAFTQFAVCTLTPNSDVVKRNDAERPFHISVFWFPAARLFFALDYRTRLHYQNQAIEVKAV